MSMEVLSDAKVRACLPWRDLIDAVRHAFREGVEAPARAAHSVSVPNAPDLTLLLMPSWRVGDKIAVKVASVAPGNAQRGIPTVSGLIFLLDAETGVVEGVMDAGEVTARRTAAASALAADLICAKSVRSLLLVGAGRLIHNLAQAHCVVRDYDEVALWARDEAKAEALAGELASEGLSVSVVRDLRGACGRADVISCATMATSPLVLGDWLKPGAHLDLVGAFRPDMRETDDRALVRARGAIYVDTFEGAMDEAGDLLQAMAANAITREDIAADLAALCRGERAGPSEDLTVFKSVGTGLEDYAAARLVAARA
ncbi:ornithine cyclodeaminase family protein [Pelagibacterium xiamenense]|uniref:ornithine cyclodeaminase family protein n=1 Tax=Pelagibacterium xiamenense TaxID=2901140 RepID=UPI001E3C91BD|nr:ornithine cyclodeaminase family protein [Pelagibacterium xiamenense]MCD7060614.1 ornithine cyclodeaminase family protein [Pelagibacterium xiamenense]